MKTYLLAALIGVWATGAMAHSALETTTPADQTSVAQMPTEITMEFRSDIRLTRVAITYAETQSKAIDLGDQTAFMRGFVVPMYDMGPGTYVVEWRGLGNDGHALNGTFSFTVE